MTSCALAKKGGRNIHYRRLLIASAVFLAAAVICGCLLTAVLPPPRPAVHTSDLGLMLLEEPEGVSVLAVRQKSLADHAGIFPGDRMLQANGVPFTTVHEFSEMLQHFDGPFIHLELMRLGEPVVVLMAYNP